MIEIKIAVKDNKLIKVRDTLLVEDTINSIRCCFEFRSGWENKKPTVVFGRGHIYPATKNPQSIPVELDGNECIVPPEIISEKGEFCVGLFGEHDNGRVVTNWLYYKTQWGCYDLGISPNPPTPNEYNQLLKALGNKSDINHIHNEYVTDDEMTIALSGKQDVISDNIYDVYGAAEAALKDAKEYTDEISAEVLAALDAEVKRATGVEGGLDARLKLVEDAMDGSNSGSNAGSDSGADSGTVDESKLEEVLAAAKKYADDEDALIEEAVDKLSDDMAVLSEQVEMAEDKIADIEADYLKKADKYDDAALSGRIKAIEDDYLVEGDKTEMSDAIAAEKERAEGAELGLQTQINTIMNNPDTEGVINSIEEFTTYINTHGKIAEGFRVGINQNKDNISANSDAIDDIKQSAVLFIEQALTDEQKTQARANIGAGRPIIDVFDELPTENIDAGTFYRLINAQSSELYYYNNQWERLKEFIQPDWSQTDESNPAAIKNKPFGMVEQMVDVVPEAEYDFYKPTDTTTDIVCFSAPGFDGNLSYNVWFNDDYLGIAKPGEMIAIPNGQFYFQSGSMVIKGGNYPEGSYKVHITEKQVVAKRLDSQWLNTQNDISAGADNDPASCRGVRNAIDHFGTVVGSLNSKIDGRVMPAIGPEPTAADEGKVLIIRNATPVWENSFGPSIATLEDIALIFEGGAS